VVNKLPPVTGYKRVKEEWQPCALAHCAQFKYLGCMVEGGPRTLAEVTHRISQARIKLQVHWKFFQSKQISLRQKLLAYKTYGVSVVAHGYAGWHLSKEALRALEHFDLQMQSIITGWDRATIAHRRQFVLTVHLRIRRLRFLEQTLEMPPSALPRQMLLALHSHLKTRPSHTRPFRGTIFMDTPDPTDLGEIIATIRDRETWTQLCTPSGLGESHDRGQTTRTPRTRTRAPR